MIRKNSMQFRIERASVSEQLRTHEKRIASVAELLYFLSCQRHSDSAPFSTVPVLPETKTQEQPK